VADKVAISLSSFCTIPDCLMPRVSQRVVEDRFSPL
jgi:hypothetical protein